MRQEPYTLIIEVVRAQEAADPYAFRHDRQDYIFRHPHGYGSAKFLWNDEVLTDLQALLHPQPEPAVVQRMGERLRLFLEAGMPRQEGWGQCEQAIVEAARTGRPIYLTFRFGAAELYSLPWELVALRSTGEQLGKLAGCLIQYEWPAIPMSSEACSSETPQRLLLGYSSAGGRVPSSAHQQAIARAASRGLYSFDPQEDILPRLSRGELELALQKAADEGRPVTHLHLLSHGTRDKNGISGLIWHASQQDEAQEFIHADLLRTTLMPHTSTIKIIVICACHSGDPGKLGNALGSIAQAIHRLGIPIVVASRLPLSFEGSIRLTEEFYRSAGGNSMVVRDAVLTAKRALIRLDSLDWASLQFYFRSNSDPNFPGHTEWRRTVPIALALLAIVGFLIAYPGYTLSWIPLFKKFSQIQSFDGGSIGTAQNTSKILEEQSIAGRVWDEQNHPIPDAQVVLILNGRSISTKTDSSGMFHFRIQAHEEAHVQLEIRKKGFNTRVDWANLGNTGLGVIMRRSQ